MNFKEEMGDFLGRIRKACLSKEIFNMGFHGWVGFWQVELGDLGVEVVEGFQVTEKKSIGHIKSKIYRVVYSRT